MWSSEMKLSATKTNIVISELRWYSTGDGFDGKHALKLLSNRITLETQTYRIWIKQEMITLKWKMMAKVLDEVPGKLLEIRFKELSSLWILF